MPKAEPDACRPRANNIVALMSAPVSAAIFQLARNHKAYAAQLLRRLNLYPGQEILLMELSEVEHLTQGQLVRTLMVDHSTVAKSLKRLEDAGLVTRRPSSEDGRVVIVSLTEAGSAVVRHVRGVWEELERTATKDLSSEQQRVIVELAALVERSVDEAMKSTA